MFNAIHLNFKNFESSSKLMAWQKFEHIYRKIKNTKTKTINNYSCVHVSASLQYKAYYVALQYALLFQYKVENII